MNGLSDSIASIAEPECSICGTEARVNGGSCVGCLLRAGLDDAVETENFDDVLSAIEVRDTDWRLGNYQILEEIGRGGMGVIYRARQRHSKRVVALKRVLSYHGDSRETLERFRREAQAAASLDHPNILPIYEVSESEGLPFFTMKYATGGSLQQAAPALSAEPRECVRLLAKIARAVAYAHREGILHRDLKPGNILLDARGEPMVSDFGLAKWIDASTDLTRSLTIFGTPGYIAPEQAEGPAAALTPAADVYSLGAILFDLLTGRPPFLGEHALAVIRQAAEKPAPKLRSLVPKADRDLETTCAKCLEREPRARYRSASDLAEDFERWLEGRPIIARPVLASTKLWRWSRRNPILGGACIACLLLAAAGAWRQVEGQRLTASLREGELARYAVTGFSILDLDSSSIESARALTLSATVRDAWKAIRSASWIESPAVQNASIPLSWREKDLRNAALDAGARAILLGTVRHFVAGERMVLTLLDASSGRVLARKTVTGEPALLAEDVGKAIVLMHGDWLRNGGRSDLRKLRMEPGLATRRELARDYLIAGEDLAGRRNLDSLDRAVECYRKAIAADPGCSLAYAQLASAIGMRVQFRMEANALDEGLAQADKAVELDGNLPEAHRAQAVCFTMLARFKEANEALLRAIELDPTYQRAPGLLGGIGAWMGRPDLALPWFRWAQSLQNQPGEYSCNIGAELAVLHFDNEAEAAFREGAEFRPELPDPTSSLASLRLEQARFEEGYVLASELARRFPDHETAIQVAADAALLTGRLAEAQGKYRRLLELNRGGGALGSGITYLSALGWVASQLGRETEALPLLEESTAHEEALLRITPRHPKHLYALAGVLAARGEDERAISKLEEAVSTGWINDRLMNTDPRFSRLANHPQFKKILSHLSERIEELRRPTVSRISDHETTKLKESR